MARRPKTPQELADLLERASGDARNRARAGTAAAQALTGGAQPPAADADRAAKQEQMLQRQMSNVEREAEPGPRRVERSPDAMDRLVSSSIDLGQRRNTSSNPRTGRSFRDLYRGGREYHVYNQNGKREVVGVKARPQQVLADRVLQQGRQQTKAAPALERLVQERLQRPKNIKRKLFARGS
jgi:hypothetical protein